MASKQRTYTAQEKRDLLELADEVGPAAAADRMGIPKGTATCWRHLARQAQAAGKEWPPTPEPESDEDAGAEELAEALAEPEAKPRKVAKVYTPSQRAQALELVAKLGPMAASRQLGISRYSLRRWALLVERAAAGEGPSLAHQRPGSG